MADGPKGLNADGADRPGPPPEIRDVGGGRSKSLGVFVALFAVAAFGGVVWYAYDQGLKKGSEATAPVITADTTPIKVRPEKPGGMQVKNKDKLVYGALRPGSSDTDTKVEQLLPPPERPLDPPKAEQAPAPATGIAGSESSTTVQITPPTVSREAPKIAPTAPTPQSSGSIPPATLQPSTPVAVAPPPPPTPAPKPAPAPTQLAPQPAPAPKPAPAPAAASAPTPKPQTAAAPSGDYRIQLGAFRGEAAANSEWNRISNRHEDVLGGLTLRLQRVDLGAGKGIFHRVQGGMVSSAEARRICAVLSERQQPCLVVRP